MSDGRVPTGPEARFYEEDDEVPDDPWEEEEEEEDLEEGFDDEDAE